MLGASHIFGQSYLLAITVYHIASLFTRKSSTPYLAPYEDVILMDNHFGPKIDAIDTSKDFWG